MIKHKIIAKGCLATLVMAISINCSVTKVLAWGGYSHWEMGQRISDNSNYIDEDKLSYSSGSLLADVGKLSWDRKYTSSDSEIFSNKILSLASDEKSTYFANGWKSHYKQDTFGALSNINGGPSSYRVKCGWVDEYLIDYKNLNSPINGTSEILVNYDLIRDTYNSLHNFTPSNSEIDKEIKKMYVAFDLQVSANIQRWSNEEIKDIENELNRTVDICMENMLGKSSSIYNMNSDSLSDNDILIANNIIESYIEELEELNIIQYNTSRATLKDSYIINYLIIDQEKYNNVLNEINDHLKNIGIDILNLKH